MIVLIHALGALPDDEAIRGHPLLSAVEWLATVYPGGDAKVAMIAPSCVSSCLDHYVLVAGW